MIVFPTSDKEKIKKVLCDPWVYDRITEDGSPEIGLYEPALSKEIIYLTDKDLTGIVIFHPVNAITQEIHVQVLDRKLAKEFVKSCFNWVWNNTETMKVIAQIPEMYPDVYRFAEKMGMEREGENTGSYLKKGSISSQFYYGIRRPSSWDL